jgi:polyisoprenoid-binding protein YceI
MSTTEASVVVPTGTWEIDASHSTVGFTARHLMVSKVRGRFTSFHGTISIAPDQGLSSVTVSIDTPSIDSRDDNRDAHLRSADFLDVETWPTMTFASTAVRVGAGERFEVDGDLTIRGVTRAVTLSGEFTGVQRDPWGGTRAGFEARTDFSRKDFGLEWNVPLDGGGVLVGDKVTVELEVEAVAS